MNLELIDFQGEVLIYGSHSELVERGVDTKQLLGLIKEGDEKEKKDEFSYEDADIEESTKQKPEEQKCNNLHANVFVIAHFNFYIVLEIIMKSLFLLTLIAPTSPLSPSKTVVSRFKELRGTPRLLKKQYSEEEEQVLRDTTDSPFDTGSIYSSPSMLSIHSDVGTSKHEDEVTFFKN